MTRQVEPTSAADDCEVTLTLASHEKPDGTFSREDAQPLYDSNTSTFGPGTHTLSVDLPAEDAEPPSMANAGASLASTLPYAWLGFPAAVTLLTVRRRE